MILDRYHHLIIKCLMSRCFVWGLMVFALDLSAKTNDVLRCENSDQELSRVATRLSDEERRELLDKLYVDLARIVEVLKAPPPEIPKNYLTRCFENKKNAFELNIKNGSGLLQNSFDVHYKKASLLELFGNLPEALKNYELAMKMRDDDPDIRLKYFRIWREVEANKIKNSQKSLIEQVHVSDYMRAFNQIVEPILRMDKSTVQHKITALRHRVSLNRDLAQHHLVAQDSELILRLDAADKDALEYLVLYHCDAERLNPVLCKKYLESYVPKFPENRATALQLLKLQYEGDDNSGVLLLSKKFLDLYPNDTDFMAWRGRALWKVGRIEESQALITAVLTINPNHPIALTTKAYTLFREAQDFEKRGLLSNALKNLEEALAIVRKAGIQNTEPALDINEKMAFIIYDFLRTQSFADSPAARADAKRIVELLTPSFQNPNLRRHVATLVDTYFHSLEISGVKNSSSSCQMMRTHKISINASSRALLACTSAAKAQN